MKTSLLTTSILSLIMLLTTQFGHAVVVKNTAPKTLINQLEVKNSPIEKALQQHKTDKTLYTEDNLKVQTALKITPSQNFFAAQNQRFTRFVQSIFSPNHS
ncbi:hypothetical protein NI467_00500 [Acinetobacter bohemicus]|uniref:hypothetical protein n=1 Tax=unclassified Acinetobacter TaxID=196816 RepID=UPI0011694B34|nr:MULTISPECIES: hypothetical protein [unclassified Acinetobacter]MDM1781469.1 hypothetical protein [Acinetobacter indicus]MCO8043858.1 hypothetical protein [Acinetobacter sp. S4397-1]TQR61113.1 hypothetical protein E2K52_12095 [Acinetobacter sp. RF14B]TSH77396.1 hypothetical protein E2K73_04030 [Acinetobacter sp. RF15A]TSI19269.1 hypothetical protein E2K74_05395 [Acinetobacter sp. RF15B]